MWEVAAVGILLAGRTMAADAGSQPTAVQLEEMMMMIAAAKIHSLGRVTATGSRLALSQEELPATLGAIDNDEMIDRGIYNAQEPADSRPGVTSVYDIKR